MVVTVVGGIVVLPKLGMTRVGVDVRIVERTVVMGIRPTRVAVLVAGGMRWRVIGSTDRVVGQSPVVVHGGDQRTVRCRRGRIERDVEQAGPHVIGGRWRRVRRQAQGGEDGLRIRCAHEFISVAA
ncbi:hypothetical protein ASG12_07565 [Williamsia sp. Leaf354]|nr:hypothetical protein ASG12_07565 [Williamsia sp. Leaf354]